MLPLLPQLLPVARRQAIFVQRAALGLHSSARKRGYTTDHRFQGDRPAGPNQDALSGINEETGGMNEATGGDGADMSNSAYVNEIIQREQSFYDNAPEGIRQEYEYRYGDSAHPDSYPAGYPQGEGQEQYYQHQQSMTNTEDGEGEKPFTTAYPSQILVDQLNYPKIFHPTATPYGMNPNNPVSKYPLPSLPLPSTSHLHYRYSPLLDQVVNLFMRDGKKATAQKNVQKVLDILRTKPPPKEQTKYNLIAGHPPLASLPRNPLAYLQTAIDSLSPLLRLRTMKGSGGFSNQVPEPLNERQRRRTAINWMLTVSNGKKGRMRFAERFAEEVVAVVEGKSSAWDRRLQIHKTAVGARANVKVKI